LFADSLIDKVYGDGYNMLKVGALNNRLIGMYFWGTVIVFPVINNLGGSLICGIIQFAP